METALLGEPNGNSPERRRSAHQAERSAVFEGVFEGLSGARQRGGYSKRVRYANFEQACLRDSSRRARGGLKPASSRTDPSRLALLEPCLMSARPARALLDVSSIRPSSRPPRAALDEALYQACSSAPRPALDQASLSSPGQALNHPVPAQLHSPSSPPQHLLGLASLDSSSRLARSLAAPPARPPRCALATKELMPCRRSTCNAKKARNLRASKSRKLGETRRRARRRRGGGGGEWGDGARASVSGQRGG